MPTTHVLTNSGGNLWHLTTADGALVDAVTAPSRAEAAVAFQHLVPRDGAWEDGTSGSYRHRAPDRPEVMRRTRLY